MIKVLASDIETCGLYPDVHTPEDIFCIASKDVVTGEIFLFHDKPEFDGQEVYDKKKDVKYVLPKRSGSIVDAIKFWEDMTEDGYVLAIHNSAGFDKQIVNKIFPDNKIPSEAYHDTLIQSKVQWFERPTPKGAKSAHGLQAYGIRCGFGKPEVEDFSVFTPWIVYRLLGDVEIQKQTYLMLEKERKFFKDTFGADFTQALKIEDMYAEECFKQELVGALVDVPHIKACIEDLDEKIEKLREEIEPQLPPTVKGDGGRVSRSEVATLLGFDGSKIKDGTLLKKINGEVEEVPEKPYYRPVVGIHSIKKDTKYQGYHPEHEFSPLFDKKKEFTDWRNENYPNTKPKEWLVDKIEEERVELKHNVVNYFECSPEDTDYIVGPYTKVKVAPSTMTQNDVVKAFLIKLGWRYADEWNLQSDVYGNYIKVEEKTEVRWPEGANPEHQLSITIPKGGYMVSSPKLGEEDYSQLPEGLGKKIAEYNTYQHRRRFLENPKDPENKGLLSYVREDGRIPCGVNNFGTRSGRGSQRVWVNAPGAKALYGEEVRKCIIAPKGKVLVGADMKSAQLSIAAYYANNSEYYNNVATGLEFDENDVYVGETAHCVNARMFGMVTEEQWQEAVRTQDPDLIHELTIIRSNSKGGSFAVIFGASGKKVAVTIGIPEKEGHARKEQFLDQMGLGDTINQLKVFQSKYPHKGGFMLPLAFGYWLWNNSPHKSVNTIVQGFEALAQKLAVVRLSREIERNGYSGQICKVLDVHDELLIETTEELAPIAGKMAGDAYTWAAEQIFKFHQKNPDQFANPEPPKFPIDLNGGYKVGLNYYDVH